MKIIDDFLEEQLDCYNNCYGGGEHPPVAVEFEEFLLEYKIETFKRCCPEMKICMHNKCLGHEECQKCENENNTQNK